MRIRAPTSAGSTLPRNVFANANGGQPKKQQMAAQGVTDRGPEVGCDQPPPSPGS
jgi:hypothetical protein